MRLFCLVCLSVCLSISAALGSVEYQVGDLGTLGGSASRGYGLNDSGTVAGYAYDGTNRPRGTIWRDSGPTQLDNLPNGLREHAQDVNASGEVIGFAESSQGSNRAVIWDADGTLRTLTSFGSGESYGRDINDAGEAVGYVYTSDTDYEAFLVRADDMMERLEGLESHDQSRATGINADGAVTGYVMDRVGLSNLATAFVWRSKDDISYLTAPTGSQSRAHAINGSGAVVGESLNSNRRWVATYWDALGQGVEIGTLGGVYSRANAISDLGMAVGFAYDDSNDAKAFRWTDSGGLEDLNDLIDPASGWELVEAWDVNGHGDIVGWGYYDGEERGFVLSDQSEVPGLPAIALVVPAAIIALRRRRRSAPPC
jgi:probable HAF family extracellular repeat protein